MVNAFEGVCVRVRVCMYLRWGWLSRYDKRRFLIKPMREERSASLTVVIAEALMFVWLGGKCVCVCACGVRRSIKL